MCRSGQGERATTGCALVEPGKRQPRDASMLGRSEKREHASGAARWQMAKLTEPHKPRTTATDQTSLPDRGHARASEDKLCPPGEVEHSHSPEANKDAKHDHDVQPLAVLRDVKVGEELVAARNRAELHDAAEVDGVLQGAGVLKPAQPHRDELARDEDAGEYDLRGEEERGQLLGRLRVGHTAADKERGRGGREAQAPGDERELEEVPLQVHDPVGDDPGLQGRQERDGQLHQRLREEVRHDAVHVCCVLAQEDGPLGGELQQQRLRVPEHGADHDVADGPKVGLDALEGPVLAADARKDAGEEQVHEAGYGESHEQSDLVPEGLLQLPSNQKAELNKEVAPLHGPGCRRLRRLSVAAQLRDLRQQTLLLSLRPGLRE
mmetsp:Transcript_1509/g.4567  ORF Transcript_1509/g.4567 Transcript_1509/m.4567 type:complete len:379 (-) Transcript_1509:887-2023(-)